MPSRDAKLLDEVKVALRRAELHVVIPWKAVPAVAAELQRLPVLLAVYEKLALADQPVRAAELVHQVEEPHDSVARKRRAGLLSVAEGVSVIQMSLGMRMGTSAG
jgi:hypothetical protein